MPRTLETQVYKFSELSNEAKERARAWFREGALDYEMTELRAALAALEGGA